MQKNIIVSGGCGFIGSHLVDLLINNGHKVTIIDNLSTGKYENLNPKATFHKLDIVEDAAELAYNCRSESFDYIYHLAAHIDLRASIKNPAFDAYQNIVGTLNVLMLAAEIKVKKFIFASTGGAIYPDKGYMVIPSPSAEWEEPNPKSPYGLSKLTCEKYIEDWVDGPYGPVDFSILRLSNVYGPRQGGGESGVISIFTDKIKKGQTLTIYGDGSQVRDFVSVYDVVKAFDLAKEIPNGIYNVSTGIGTDLNKIVSLFQENVNEKIIIDYQPFIPGEMRRSCLANGKIQRAGWKPQIDIRTGIKMLLGK